MDELVEPDVPPEISHLLGLEELGIHPAGDVIYAPVDDAVNAHKAKDAQETGFHEAGHDEQADKEYKTVNGYVSR